MTNNSKIANVTVLGAGAMGRGIAVACATNGIAVTLSDIDGNVLRTAAKDVKSIARRLESSGFIPSSNAVIDKVSYESSRERAIGDSELVLESIPENLQLKRELFKYLGVISKKDVVLASNTSGLSITKIASKAKRPERIVGIHFFAPSYILKTVEIIPGQMTSGETLRRAEHFALSIGKYPVVLSKYTKNFVVNSIQFAMLREARRLVKMGVVRSIADVDKAVSHSFPVRQILFGLFRDSDLISPYSSLTHIGRKDMTTNYTYPDNPNRIILTRDSLLARLEMAAEEIRKDISGRELTFA